MRCKWFEISVSIDGRWESFENDNIFKLAYQIMKAKSKKKRIGYITINFPR